MIDTGVYNENVEIEVKGGMIHFILSHSYLIFFLAVIFGAIFHTIFNIRIFSGSVYPSIGFGMIIVGPILIYWAQRASGYVKKLSGDNRSEKDFEHGPYKYSRNPTHIGITIMVIGLGLILNSFFTVIFAIVASLITKFIFLKEEEKMLEKKYGQPYLDYKKKVNSWI